MQEQSIPVPLAIKELILSNNLLLTKYQQELSTKVVTANTEMMRLLGLSPEDGWRLDMDRMMYVKPAETQTE